MTVGASSSSLAEDTASSTGSSPPSSYDNSPNSRPNKQAIRLDDHHVESVCLLDSNKHDNDKDGQHTAPSINNFSSFGRNAKLTSNYGPIAVRTGRNNAIDESINVEDCSLGKRENFYVFFCKANGS